MIEVPFKIFPSIGYINSQFQIVSFHKNCGKITIEKDNSIQKVIDLEQRSSAIFTDFKESGVYHAKCMLNGKIYSQDFEIKKSIRLGTSEFKSSFTFEDIPYSFFLMKDRMLIYDENNKYLLSENNISPSEIQKIDNQNLLFITRIKNEKDGIVNYAMFSLTEFRIVWELKNSYKDIAILQEEKLLWVHNYINKQVICFSLKEIKNNQPEEILNFQVEYKFNKLENLNYLFVDSKESISFINLKNAKINQVNKHEDVSVDKQGNLYHLNGGVLIGKNLLEDNSKEVKIGKPQYLNLANENLLFIGNNFVVIEETNFESKTKELIRKYHPEDDEKGNYLYCNLNADERSESGVISHSLFLSSDGTYLLTKTEKQKIRSITFRKNTFNNWSAVPGILSSINYSLSFIGINTNNELKKGLSSCLLIYSNQDYIFFKAGTNILIVKGNEIIKELDSSLEILILPNFNHNDYLLIESADKQSSLFSFTNFANPILKDVEILNKEFLRKHGVIWYAGNAKRVPQQSRLIAAFNLNQNKKLIIDEHSLKHSAFKDATDFTFTESYFLSSTATLLDPKTGAAMDASIGKIISTSENLNKIVSRRGDLIYLLTFDINIKKYSVVEIKIAVNNYKEAYLSPNGKFLILQKNVNQYILFDIQKREELSFFSGKFLAFSKEGNLIFEENNSRAAKIIDPLTQQDITPPNYHYYRFISPDGQLYSQVSTKKRYYDKINCKYIDLPTVTKLKIELDLSLLNMDEEIKSKILNNRKIFFDLHKSRLEELGVTEYENINSNTVIKFEHFTEIGIVGTSEIAEIHFPLDLVFFNYAAFSYDNKYFGYVGKPSLNGLIHIFKLEFNSNSKTLKIEDEYLSRYPRWASWVCGFSKHGYFATYDSTPDTYILKADNDLFQKKYTDQELREKIVRSNSTIYSSYNKWTEIKGKNFLCFTPSGNYIALSEQGYEPLTLGGYGHQESGALHIASTSEGTIFDSFLEHGDIIKDDKSKKIVFVAFSEDESKIMSMSKDGVVIVRNIDLKNFNERKPTVNATLPNVTVN